MTTRAGVAMMLCCGIAAAVGGHVAAVLANERKLRHSLQVLVLPAALIAVVYLALFLVATAVKGTHGLLEELGDGVSVTAALWAAGAVAALLGGLLLGGLSERWVVAAGRAEWTYVTDAGRRLPAWGPRQYPLLTWGWWAVGWACLGLAWVPFAWRAKTVDGYLDALCMIALWRPCLAMARRWASASAGEALARTAEPPVVYLGTSQPDDAGRPGGEALTASSRSFWSLFVPTAEQLLARTMGRFGPVVAVGRPLARLPEIGAARMYVGTDDDWQQVVTDLLRRPGAVAVIQAGGPRWELAAVARTLRPEQVVLFVPFGLWVWGAERERLYDEFRAWAETCLPTRLPDYLDESSCFVYFTADQPGWGAHLLTGGAGRVAPRHPLGPVLKTLRDTGGFWKRPRHPTSRAMLVAASVLSIVIVLSCLGFLMDLVARLRDKAQSPPAAAGPPPEQAPRN
jgi:hypothetical protein